MKKPRSLNNPKLTQARRKHCTGRRGFKRMTVVDKAKRSHTVTIVPYGQARLHGSGRSWAG